MAAEKVVFLGNCQAAALADLYRTHIGRPSGQVVTYADSFVWDEADQKALTEADVAIVQLADFRAKGTADNLRTGVKRFEFPMVVGGFFWPFGSQPHPQSPSVETFDGPYPAQLGDAFLNQMIAKGLAPEVAVQRYLALDINKEINLDRLFEFCMERQRRRDAQTGYDLARTIEAYFRDEQLFLTPVHPNLRIFNTIFSRICNEMGVAAARVETALASLTHSPLPLCELPIHPAVAKHFGLRFADENTRYRYFDEGTYTFAEFITRYMKFEHGEDLRQGMRLFGLGRTEEAIARLRIGLQEPQRSAVGHHAMSVMLGWRGEVDEAIINAQRAVRLDPRASQFHVHLAELLARRGDLSEAEQVLRAAIETGPADERLFCALSFLCVRQRRIDEAIAALRSGLKLNPSNAHARAYLSTLLVNQDDPAGAEQEIRAAISLAPAVGDFRAALGHLLVAKGGLEEAETELRAAIALNPSDAGVHNWLGNLLARQGRVDEAVVVLREALKLDGANPHVRAYMANLLIQKDELAEVLVHVQNVGDVRGDFGAWVGTPGSRHWIEGFCITPRGDIAPEDIEYKAVFDRSWSSPWMTSGIFCGCRGAALPILGFGLRLRGAAARTYACHYSATFVDGSVTGPVAAGTLCHGDGLAPLEAIWIAVRRQ